MKKRLNTTQYRTLAGDIRVRFSESTDARKRVLEFDSDIPIPNDLFYGCLLHVLERYCPQINNYPELEKTNLFLN